MKERWLTDGKPILVSCFLALALIKVVGLQYFNFVPWRSYLSNSQPIENNAAIPDSPRTLPESTAVLRRLHYSQIFINNHSSFFRYQDTMCFIRSCIKHIYCLPYECLNQVWFSWTSQLVCVRTYFVCVLTTRQDKVRVQIFLQCALIFTGTNSTTKTGRKGKLCLQ